MPAHRVSFVHKNLGLFLGIDENDVPWFAKANHLRLDMASTFDNVENARVFFITRVRQINFDDMRIVEVEPSRGMFATMVDLARAGVTDDEMGDLMLYQSFLPGIH